MNETTQTQMSPADRLDDLLGDSGFRKVIDLVTLEVTRHWNVSRGTAHGFVLSAIGEPETLGSIHNAWLLARSPGESPGLAKLIVRRRVIDLLRRDARQSGHCSLPASTEVEAADPALAFNDLLERSPRAQLELQQIVRMVRGALACFAGQGRIQQRQAHLLQRYALDEVHYAALSTELESSENALRVRVHKAMLALRRHIGVCHPELEGVLERRRRAARTHVT